MKSRMVVTLCMLVCASTCTTGCRGEPQATTEVNDKQLSAEQIRKDPMTIAASSVGDFARGHSWYLSVNSAGDASLTIKTVPTKTVRHFKVSRKQLEELREEIIRQDFFGLKDGYGESVLVLLSKFA